MKNVEGPNYGQTINEWLFLDQSGVEKAPALLQMKIISPSHCGSFKEPLKGYMLQAIQYVTTITLFLYPNYSPPMAGI